MAMASEAGLPRRSLAPSADEVAYGARSPLKLSPVSYAKASATEYGRSLAPPLKLRRHADGEGLSDSVSYTP